MDKTGTIAEIEGRTHQTFTKIQRLQQFVARRGLLSLEQEREREREKSILTVNYNIKSCLLYTSDAADE